MAQHQTAHLVNVDNRHTALLQERLVREITGLERQLEQLQRECESVDFSMEQTYREMIHSRRELLNNLPPQPRQ